MELEGAHGHWVCQTCGNQIHGKLRPGAEMKCVECGDVMRCMKALPSDVHGVGVNKELDLGLAILMEAQKR